MGVEWKGWEIRGKRAESKVIGMYKK